MALRNLELLQAVDVDALLLVLGLFAVQPVLGLVEHLEEGRAVLLGAEALVLVGELLAHLVHVLLHRVLRLRALLLLPIVGNHLQLHKHTTTQRLVKRNNNKQKKLSIMMQSTSCSTKLLISVLVIWGTLAVSGKSTALVLRFLAGAAGAAGSP